MSTQGMFEGSNAALSATKAWGVIDATGDALKKHHCLAQHTRVQVPGFRFYARTQL